MIEGVYHKGKRLGQVDHARQVMVMKSMESLETLLQLKPEDEVELRSSQTEKSRTQMYGVFRRETLLQMNAIFPSYKAFTVYCGYDCM